MRRLCSRAYHELPGRGLAATLLCWATVVAGEPLQCHPAVKTSCNEQGCQVATEGFQHAERFSVDLLTGRISACLWTSCYAGKGKILKSADGAQMTVAGRLTSVDNTATYPPRVVSITVDRAGKFVAVWDYAGSGLVFDQGRCQTASRR